VKRLLLRTLATLEERLETTGVGAHGRPFTGRRWPVREVAGNISRSPVDDLFDNTVLARRVVT
jgi:hypothetical protein